MQITPEEFMKLCAPISERDAEIATLRKELELFRGRAGEVVEMQADANFITLKTEKICQVLNELKGNPTYVGILFVGLLKMMSKDISMAVVQRMLASASLECIPLNLIASGDLNVQGVLNIIKENNNVHFGNT